MTRATTASVLALAGLAICDPHPAAEAATLRDSIVVGGSKHPRLLDPDTGKLRTLSGLATAFDFQFGRTADGRSLLDVDWTADGPVVLRYSLASGTTQKSGPFSEPEDMGGIGGFSPDGRDVAV